MSNELVKSMASFSVYALVSNNAVAKAVIFTLVRALILSLSCVYPFP